MLHAWVAELVPLDDAVRATRIRRVQIGSVEADRAGGLVRLTLPATTVELPGLGAAATAWGQRLGELRDGALRDAARLVGGRVPDAPFGSRNLLGRLLVDGRPASVADLGAELARVDGSVLTEPTFAASFRDLLARGGGDVRWFALAPDRPGSDTRKAWYLVALPGNLIALELVSEGAHATYLFRSAPRSTYSGEGPAAIAEQHVAAARDISAALIDARFLREPMALLASARYLRYHLALAALPSQAAARRRFVARLVHDDPTRWAKALDDLSPNTRRRVTRRPSGPGAPRRRRPPRPPEQTRAKAPVTATNRRPMPAYKVACPRCANLTMRDAAVCPFCHAKDPFAPMRCASCSAIMEDPRWAACQRCGTPVPKPGTSAAAMGAPTAAQTARPAQESTPQPAAATPAAVAPPAAPAGRFCTGCGGSLVAGARFCTVCGTIAG